MTKTLLDMVRKAAARLTTNHFDDELELLIAAAKDDLTRQGVDKGVVRYAKKPLVKLAVVTYCKAHFGLDNPDSEKYRAAYQSMADELRKSAGYRSEASAP